MANLFHKIDQRGVGQVTIDDFEKHFTDDAAAGMTLSHRPFKRFWIDDGTNATA